MIYSLVFSSSKRISEIVRDVRDLSNKFFDSVKYYEKFHEYLQDFIDKLRLKVDFSSFLYFYYRILQLNHIFLSSFLKDLKMRSSFLNTKFQSYLITFAHNLIVCILLIALTIICFITTA